MGDIIKISRGITKQDELFDYIEASDYYKERVSDYDKSDNFELGLYISLVYNDIIMLKK